MIFCVDVVIVYSKTEHNYITPLWKIFEKFHYTGLKLKPSECDIGKLQIEYLGHVLSGTGIYPLKQKVQAILHLAPPSNVTQVRHILGLASYYRKFIPMFSLIVSPITSLTKMFLLFGQQLVKMLLIWLNGLLLIALYSSIQTHTNNTTCSLMHQIIHGQVC